MSKSNRALWRIASRPRKPHFVCSSCLSALRQVQRASNSTSSATATTFSESHDTSPDPSEESTSADPTLATSASPSKTHIVKAAVLLSRAPLLTRDLTTFEKSYFLYQKRLNERLALPFTRYFYYGRNTPGEVEWKRKIKERLTAARDIGRYVGYGKEAWNDEVVLGTAEAAIADPDVIRETLVQDSEQEVKRRNEEGEEEIVKVTVERPMPRRTEADERTDLRSLNRAFTRTLYLLVKGPEKKGLLKGQRPHGEWTFPMSELREDEPLDMAGRRIIKQASGTSMNVWTIGNVPIGHQVYNYVRPLVDEAAESKTQTQTQGEKTFYMKARVLAGKPELKDNSLGLLDYQWLAKEEIRERVSPADWAAVKNVLAER